MLVYITLANWSISFLTTKGLINMHTSISWYRGARCLQLATDGFACFLLATFLVYNVTWVGVEPLQQVMSGFWRMDGPELLGHWDAPMARIAIDRIASPPVLPLNGQRSLIPSPEVAAHKFRIQEFNPPSYFDSFLLMLIYISDSLSPDAKSIAAN